VLNVKAFFGGFGKIGLEVEKTKKRPTRRFAWNGRIGSEGRGMKTRTQATQGAVRLRTVFAMK
jgi:hypothetical protein